MLRWLRNAILARDKAPKAILSMPSAEDKVGAILAERHELSDLPVLDLDEYRDLVAHLPRPTLTQIHHFADYVTGAKSWYKHLPPAGPGIPFQFFVDPWAGLDRVLLKNHEAVHVHRVDAEQRFHYTWMKTEEYRSQFARLAFSCGCGSELFMSVSHLLEGEREIHGCLDINPSRPAFYVSACRECRLPPEILEAGKACLTGVIHDRASELWLLSIWPESESLPDDCPGLEFIEKVASLARRVRPRLSELMSESHRAERKQVETELEGILAPERQRQHDNMVNAIQRVVDLLYGTSD